MFQDYLTYQPIDPVAEQELVNSIATNYYNDQTFDIAQYELQVNQQLFVHLLS